MALYLVKAGMMESWKSGMMGKTQLFFPNLNPSFHYSNIPLFLFFLSGLSVYVK